MILSVADEAQNQAIVVLREGPVRAGNPTFGVTCDGWVLDLVTEPLVLSDGHDVTLWLWPTLVAGARAAMPEFLNEEARDWMTAHYGAGLRAGVRRLAIGDTSTPYSVRCAACRRSYEVTYELSRCWHCQAELRAVWAG